MQQVQSRDSGTDAHVVAQRSIESSVNWIIGAVVGGGLFLAAGLSVLLYFLSRRRKMQVAMRTLSTHGYPSTNADPERHMADLDSASTLHGFTDVPLDENEKKQEASPKRGLRGLFQFKRSDYLQSIAKKNTLKKPVSSHRNSVRPPAQRNSTWIDEDAIHGPDIMARTSQDAEKIKRLSGVWAVGSPTLPEISVGSDFDMRLSSEMKGEASRNLTGIPYSVSHVNLSGPTLHQSAPRSVSLGGVSIGGYGLGYPTAHGPTGLTPSQSFDQLPKMTLRTPTRSVSMPRNISAFSSKSDKELQSILRNTDERLLSPPSRTSAISSIMRTPTSATTRSLKSSPSRTPVYETTPQPNSPEQARLACTLNVSKWQILTPDDMKKEQSVNHGYVSDSEDEDIVGIDDDEDDDEHESILTQEFSTVLSPAVSFLIQNNPPPTVDKRGIIAPGSHVSVSATGVSHGEREVHSPSGRSDVSSALSTLYSADEREDERASPGAMSDTSTKIDSDSNCDSSPIEGIFSSEILGSFPHTKHLSAGPLNTLADPQALKAATRQAFSCPPPRRGEVPIFPLNLTGSRNASSTSPKTSQSPSLVSELGSPIRQRASGGKLNIPQSPPSINISSDQDVFGQTQMKRVRPSDAKDSPRSRDLTAPSKPEIPRIIAPHNNYMAGTLTPSSSVRSRSLSARQKFLAESEEKYVRQKGLRPMRSSPTLGSHDHGSASVSSPGTSGSSSPESSGPHGLIYHAGRQTMAAPHYPLQSLVVSRMRSASGSSELPSTYSSNSLLSVHNRNMTPSPSFQKAMARGAGPSGVFLPQSISSSSFQVSAATALDVTITELRHRNSYNSNNRAYSYSGVRNRMPLNMGLMDSPTLPHKYTSTPISQYAHQGGGMVRTPSTSSQTYSARRRTHTGMTSSGSVSHLGNNRPGSSRRTHQQHQQQPQAQGLYPKKRRPMQVLSKASREDMREGLVRGQSSLSMSYSSSSMGRAGESDVPPLTASNSTWTNANGAASPAAVGKPVRKPSVTFAQTDDVLFLSDDSILQRFSFHDDSTFMVDPDYGHGQMQMQMQRRPSKRVASSGSIHSGRPQYYL